MRPPAVAVLGATLQCAQSPADDIRATSAALQAQLRTPRPPAQVGLRFLDEELSLPYHAALAARPLGACRPLAPEGSDTARHASPGSAASEQACGTDAAPALPLAATIGQTPAQPALLPGDALIELLLGHLRTAAADAGWPEDALACTPVFLGSTAYLVSEIEKRLEPYYQPTSFLTDLGEHALTHVARLLQQRLGNPRILSVATSCTASANALLLAMQALRGGLHTRALVLGFECFNRMTLAHFHALGILQRDLPHVPLSGRDEQGLLLGEGIGCLALDSQPPAGCQALAWIEGVAAKTDTAGLTLTDADAVQALMQAALDDAGLSAGDITLLKAHGVGSPTSDGAEAAAVTALLPVTTPVALCKPFIGHTLGASGAAEVALMIGALHHGTWPALPAADAFVNGLLPVAADGLALKNGGGVLMNFLGFGGSNISLVLGAGARRPALSATRPVPPMPVPPVPCQDPAWQSPAEGRLPATGPLPSMPCLQVLAVGRHDSDTGVSETALRAVLKAHGVDGRRLSRFTLLSLAAALPLRASLATRAGPVGIYLGAPFSSPACFMAMLDTIRHGRTPRPFDFIGNIHNAACFEVARALGLDGPSLFMAVQGQPPSVPSLAHPLQAAALALQQGQIGTALVGWCTEAWPPPEHAPARPEGCVWLLISLADAGCTTMPAAAAAAAAAAAEAKAEAAAEAGAAAATATAKATTAASTSAAAALELELEPEPEPGPRPGPGPGPDAGSPYQQAARLADALLAGRSVSLPGLADQPIVLLSC